MLRHSRRKISSSFTQPPLVLMGSEAVFFIAFKTLLPVSLKASGRIYVGSGAVLKQLFIRRLQRILLTVIWSILYLMV